METTTEPIDRQQMNIAFVGHVDHGKSTVVGRLLVETESLPTGKLDEVRATCERNSKPFEYAFLIDALKDEQAQGITIDSARVFFKTAARDYIIIDAPGHIEFLKNMVTGAARAEAAFLVIDAYEGIRENSRRHGYLLSMLGIRQICVLVNKMDLVDYSKQVYQRIVRRYRRFLSSVDVTDVRFIPVSAFEGENISVRSEKMSWYAGATVLQQLDRFKKEPPAEDLPLRMPVQDVYKFTNFGDRRRVIAGMVESGALAVGDEVVFYPSAKRGRVETIEVFNAEVPNQVEAGRATGFTLDEQIYVRRGELVAKSDQAQPLVGSRIVVSLFWLGREPMRQDKEYLFKLGTARVPVRLESIERVMDASSLKTTKRKFSIDQHDVAECVLSFAEDVAFDPVDLVPATSRFVIVDSYEIAGGGIIRSVVEDDRSWVRENIRLRNFNWRRSPISPIARAERYNQRPTLILLSGPDGETGEGVDLERADAIATRLEERLFNAGKLVYHLGVGNLQLGLSSDISEMPHTREEHLRRVAEVAHLFLDAGIILIASVSDLAEADLEMVRASVNPETIETVWVGSSGLTDLAWDERIDDDVAAEDAVAIIVERLKRRGAIFSIIDRGRL